MVSANGDGDAVLEVRDLRTYFATRWGLVKAVDGISFQLHRGETLGIVGESGCGKSVTALSIMRLVPSPPGHIVGGQVLIEGDDILQINEGEMEKVRGGKIALILQDPMTALNHILIAIAYTLVAAVIAVLVPRNFPEIGANAGAVLGGVVLLG